MKKPKNVDVLTKTAKRNALYSLLDFSSKVKCCNYAFRYFRQNGTFFRDMAFAVMFFQILLCFSLLKDERYHSVFRCYARCYIRLTQIGHQDFSVSYGKEKSFNFFHMDKNDCRVFSDLAKYRICLSFVLPRQAGVDSNSYRIVFRNFFLLELISACLNNDIKLYAITMKLPHASVAQKLCVTKSSMEKSFFSSFIPNRSLENDKKLFLMTDLGLNTLPFS